MDGCLYSVMRCNDVTEEPLSKPDILNSPADKLVRIKVVMEYQIAISGAEL